MAVSNGDGVESEVLAGNVRELDAAVSELIGLDFSQFTRTVVLPQGDFARFLTDKPGDRQKLLTKVLNLGIYTEMGRAAREAARVAANQAEALESELARQEIVDDDRLHELEASVAALDRLGDEVEARLEELAGIDEALSPIRDRVVEADRERELLGAVMVPDDLDRSEVELAEADEAIAAATAEVVEARTARDDNQTALADIGDRSRLVATLARFDRRDEAAEALATAGDKMTGLRAQAKQADAREAAARAVLDAARTGLSDARRSVDAAVWTARLVEGEPCPVCHQTVTDIPDHPHDETAELEAAVAEAESALAEVSETRSRLSGTMEATDQRIDELRRTIKELDAELDGLDRAVLVDQQERLGQLDEQMASAQRTLKAAEQRLAAHTDVRRRVVDGIDRRSNDFAGQRDAVSHLKPPTPKRSSLLADWTALAAWADDHRQRLAGERDELATRGKELAGQRGELLAQIRDAVEPFGLDPDPARLVAAVAVARSEARAGSTPPGIEGPTRSGYGNRVDELSADREINEALGRHLKADGFEGWLLNEALDDIVGRATVWLRELVPVAPTRWPWPTASLR